MLADEALLRAWRLVEDFSEAVEDELGRLLPTLIAAGYAEADERTWRFTPEGVNRVELLGRE